MRTSLYLGVHARRGFHRAQDESAFSKAVFKDIQELYRVEAELRDAGAGAYYAGGGR